jgi:hypothetical protein
MGTLTSLLALLLDGSPQAPQKPRKRSRGRASRGRGKQSGSRRQGGQRRGKQGVRSPRPQSRRGPSPLKGRPWKGIAYHGTPSAENARSIVRHGFMVGSGNAAGDGIYLSTAVSTAKSYAGSRGVYLRCRVHLSRVCTWSSALQSRYAAWCLNRGVRSDNSARTAFLIQHGFDGVVNAGTIVVLAPQYANPTAWKRKRSRKVRVLSAYNAATGKQINL